jgi:hypothetical protein
MARGRFTFWLDYNKDEELLLAETINELKHTRLFSKSIRDGIRLVNSLRKGKLDVLFELFPWVKAEFLAGVQPKETAGEKALREQLQRLENLLLEQGNRPISLPAKSTITIPEIGEIPSIFVEEPTTNPGETRANFAASMGDLFADDSDDLWDDEDDATMITTNKDTKIDSTQNAINSLNTANP